MRTCAYDFCRRTRCSTYQHDSESDLDYAMARYYASRSGRFMTPDPGHVGANLGDPQSWNAYVYGQNDAINLIDPTGETISEIVPAPYIKQYEMWKGLFMSSKSMQDYWNKIDADPDFLLSIVVDTGHDQGAQTDGYLYDSLGRLVAATITLGHNADKGGFPDVSLYPITAILSELGYERFNGLLATTKWAHEFGHVLEVSKVGQSFEQQSILMQRIDNLTVLVGPKSPLVLGLVDQLQGLPEAIRMAREVAADSYTIPFLTEHYMEIGRRMPGPIRRAIDEFNRQNKR